MNDIERQVNIPLLRKAVEWAEAEAAKPEIDRQWDQQSWSRSAVSRAARLSWDLPEDIDDVQHEQVLAAHCGTSYCIAGYVGQLLDARYASDVRPSEMPHVSEFAADALGIEPPERFVVPEGHLFHEGNTIADVRRIAEEIAGERL